jgi:hypothetical protein
VTESLARVGNDDDHRHLQPDHDGHHRGNGGAGDCRGAEGDDDGAAGAACAAAVGQNGKGGGPVSSLLSLILTRASYGKIDSFGLNFNTMQADQAPHIEKWTKTGYFSIWR